MLATLRRLKVLNLQNVPWAGDVSGEQLVAAVADLPHLRVFNAPTWVLVCPKLHIACRSTMLSPRTVELVDEQESSIS